MFFLISKQPMYYYITKRIHLVITSSDFCEVYPARFNALSIISSATRLNVAQKPNLYKRSKENTQLSNLCYLKFLDSLNIARRNRFNINN